MIPLKKAIDLINKNVIEIKKFDEIKIKEGLTRILAKNYKAKFNSPIYDTSSMDGIVILKDDLNKIKQFKIVGEIKAGSKLNKELISGEAKSIFTGAFIPGKKKKIVIQNENCIFNTGQTQVTIKNKKDLTNNIRLQGSNFKKGEVCLKRNSSLNIRSLSLANSLELEYIKVKSKPKIAVIITGDEIKSESNPDGQINSSNTIIIEHLTNYFGGEVIEIKFVFDLEEDIKKKFESFDDYDLLVTSGGLSVGKYDLIKSSLKKKNLSLIFEKVLIKPGKPISFGKFKKNKYFLGLPGNPVSCFIGSLFFLSKIIQNLKGEKKEYLKPIFAKSASFVSNNNHLTSINRLKIIKKENCYFFKILDSQDSSLLNLLAQSDGFIIREPNSQNIKVGTIHKIYLFSDFKNFNI